tara:strand:- start:478 stop:873 length:396 start_codon:yes stop_codon:yes gene_type:complete
MGNKRLTKNFNQSEFDCRDGSIMPVDVFENIVELAENLQVLRDFVRLPIKVNSGFRTPEYNALLVGGAKNSQHLLGKAGDIVINGLQPVQVADIIMELIDKGQMKQGGIGVYNTFCHYDTRGNSDRWDYRK